MTGTDQGGRVCVLGGGAWGTALARHLSLGGEDVRLWVLEKDLAASMALDRENSAFLPGFELPPALGVTSSLEEAVEDAAWILLVVPAQHCRSVLARAVPLLSTRPPVIVATKGIENRTLMRVSEIVADVVPESRSAGTAVVSGPSFAREVAAGRPTALVAASRDESLAVRAQALLSRENVRVYTSPDAVGVELGGALKNVIAIAGGVVDGLALGPNTLAALITRGLAEISRLAVALGGRRETLAGLAGLGDLVLTCTGSQSRNHQVGVELGRGRSIDDVLAGMKMVAEGVPTARSALGLGRREGVSMPITEKVHAVLFEGAHPAQAIRDLLARPPRPEGD